MQHKKVRQIQQHRRLILIIFLPSTAIFSGLETPHRRPDLLPHQVSECLNQLMKHLILHLKVVVRKEMRLQGLNLWMLHHYQFLSRLINNKVVFPLGVRRWCYRYLVELLHGSVSSNLAVADELPVIEIYTQEELIALINDDKHLHRVADIDECQLVKDIELRARVVMIPLLTNICGGTCY